MQETCGVDLDEATIWRVLKRSGYSMKKVGFTSLDFKFDKYVVSSQRWQLNEAPRRGLNLLPVLELTIRSNLFLLTRVQLTVEHHIVTEHGQ